MTYRHFSTGGAETAKSLRAVAVMLATIALCALLPSTASAARDRTPPKVTITQPANLSTVKSQSVTIRFTVSEPATTTCRIDTRSAAACASPYSITGLSTGWHTVKVSARDAAGNVGSASVIFKFAPATPPSVTISSPTQGQTLTTSSVSVSFTVTPGSGGTPTLTCKIDAQPAVTCATSTSHVFNGVANGVHQVTVVATDGGGNVGSASVSFSVAVSTLPRYTQVSAGRLTTCALRNIGDVRCWGFNDSGQLGNGTIVDSNVPVQVITGAGGPALTGVRKISVGSYVVCALMDNATLMCWGRNIDGEAGIGTPSTSVAYPTTVISGPGSTSPLTNVVDVSAGATSVCALLADSTVKCWGYNADGRLGDNTTIDRAAPVSTVTSATNPAPLSGVVSLSSGAYHACAALADTNVVCWGDNAYAQINDQIGVHALAPVPIYLGGGTSGTRLSGVDSVAGGGWHTCVRTTSARAMCWGLSTSGELGRGYGVDTSPSYQPDPQFVVAAHGSTAPVDGVTNLTPASDCFVTSDTLLRCWGANNSGQLGDGTTTDRDFAATVHSGPGSTISLSGIVSADSGTAHTCVSLTDGTLRCWGENAQGSIGDGTNTNRYEPVPVG